MFQASWSNLNLLYKKMFTYNEQCLVFLNIILVIQYPLAYF